MSRVSLFRPMPLLSVICQICVICGKAVPSSGLPIVVSHACQIFSQFCSYMYPIFLYVSPVLSILLCAICCSLTIVYYVQQPCCDSSVEMLAHDSPQLRAKLTDPDSVHSYRTNSPRLQHSRLKGVRAHARGSYDIQSPRGASSSSKGRNN